MGYHHILSKSLPAGHKAIALGVLQRNLGGWKSGAPARIPEIDVRMISNFSRIYQKAPVRWWSRLIHKFGIL
jgi:hypothetical protein